MVVGPGDMKSLVRRKVYEGESEAVAGARLLCGEREQAVGGSARLNSRLSKERHSFW